MSKRLVNQLFRDPYLKTLQAEEDVIVGHWQLFIRMRIWTSTDGNAQNMTIALVSDAVQVPLDKLPIVVHPCAYSFG
jgi:hypothetical protein